MTAEVIQPLRQTRITVADKVLHCSRRTKPCCRERGGACFKNNAGTAQSVNQIRYSAAPAPVTTELGAKLLALLQAGALSLEKLTEQSGAAFAAVSMELLDLQAAGLVATDQAQRYYRK